jgi:hypothetical protein
MQQSLLKDRTGAHYVIQRLGRRKCSDCVPIGPSPCPSTMGSGCAEHLSPEVISIEFTIRGGDAALARPWAPLGDLPWDGPTKHVSGHPHALERLTFTDAYE